MKTEKQIAHYTECKATLHQDYADHLLNEEEYISIGQDYAKKIDDLQLYLAELNREIKKYETDYRGSEKWENLIREYRNQDGLSRDMLERFIDKIVAHNDGRIEIYFSYKDELESVLYLAAERKREEMRYAV